MSARVEYRLGSIFDEACDVLVIPSSAGGTVTPSMAEQLREAGIPFPTAMSWGAVQLDSSTVHKFGIVAYAAAVGGQGTTVEIVKGIGERLGSIAVRHRASRISAPLLGAGAGDLPPVVAAEALSQGFLHTAPDHAVLMISVRRPEVYKALENCSAPGGTSSGERVIAVRTKHGTSLNEERPTLPPAPSAWKPQAARAPEPVPPPAAHVLSPLVRDDVLELLEMNDVVVPAEEAARLRTRPAEPSRPPAKRSRVFISYSHKDAEWLERLRPHLRPLEREGAFVWDDTRIKAGAQWRAEIRDALAETRVAILLVSADFLASEFIVTDELPPLLKAAEEDGATILPVIISPCRFTRMESLSRFQAVNDPSKPLVQMRRGNREKVLDQVARAVEDALAR